MENCIIIYDCSEEQSMGSSPDKVAYPFTDIDLAKEFVAKFNKYHKNIKSETKAKDEANKYYGMKDWVYWLEIDYDGILNQNPTNVYPD